jgi:hypothetical protein
MKTSLQELPGVITSHGPFPTGQRPAGGSEHGRRGCGPVCSKGCEQRFPPRQARQRYCSESCREEAEVAAVEGQRYRETAAGLEKRNGQSRRYQMRSTIPTSQLPVSRRHEQTGDPTTADGIPDRLSASSSACFLRWTSSA